MTFRLQKPQRIEQNSSRTKKSGEGEKNPEASHQWMEVFQISYRSKYRRIVLEFEGLRQMVPGMRLITLLFEPSNTCRL